MQSVSDKLSPSLSAANRMFAEAMADAFFAVGQGARITYVNRVAERLWRRDRHDLLGRPLLDAFPELTGSIIHAAVRRALQDSKESELTPFDPVSCGPVALKVVPTEDGAHVFFHAVRAHPDLEATMRRRDQILTLAEESAGIGIWEVDLRTELVTGTPQFFRLMGLSPTQHPVPIATFRAQRDADDQQRLSAQFLQAMADGLDYVEAEYRLHRPDGETRIILGRGRVTRDPEGQPILYNGVDLDVTDRRAAQAALLDSEARFRGVFEQSPMGMVTTGTDFIIREVNPAFCEMLGYTAQELVGRAAIELIHPDDRTGSTARGNALVSGRTELIQIEERLLRRSGESLWIRANVAPLRGLDGSTRSTLAIIENISEPRRMIQALHDSERRLRQVNEVLESIADSRGRALASSRAQLQTFFEISPDWLTMQKVGPDGSIVYAELNRTCEAGYGLSRDQVIGRTLEDVLGQEAAQLPLSNLRACAATGEVQRYVANRTMGGRTRTLDVMVLPVPGENEAGERFLITAARDITEREAMEGQLRHATKMEALGKLTGGVAHDFNNLLAVIMGSVELVRRRPEALPGLLDGIDRAAQRGVTLTRRLSSFSRHQSEGQRVIDLSAEMPRIQEMLRASLRGNIVLDVAHDGGVWPIEVDPSEFDIAVLNIAVNARDAMPDGGVFEIDVRNIEIAEQELVRLRFTDTGGGIPPHVIAHVFDPFFTTKPPGAGTGLGLSQVYGFARQSGGSVAVNSEPARGTVITLDLPRSRHRPVVENAPELDPARLLNDCLVLVVEDNPDVASVTSQMLTAMGATVEVVDRARLALLRLKADGPRVDLLVSDIIMPDGMNGVELARQVRASSPGLPIILVSGYRGTAQMTEAEFPLLTKPVAYRELARTIQEQLARQLAALGD